MLIKNFAALNNKVNFNNKFMQMKNQLLFFYLD